MSPSADQGSTGEPSDARTPRCQQCTDTACFHAINRGQNRETIFADDAGKRSSWT
jgi:hypothetical protein